MTDAFFPFIIESLNGFLLSIYYVPGTIFDFEIRERKIDVAPTPMEILSLEGDRHHANVKCITLIVGKRVT
jgi:hypothetical protein